MSPTITISKGERIITLEISDRAAKTAAHVLQNKTVDKFNQYLAREYDPDKAKLIDEVLKLGESLDEASK